MSATPVGLVGVIRASVADPAAVGRFVEVVDDTLGATGGAYVCEWTDSVGYDSWVERLDLVDEFMAEAGYVVEWFQEAPEASLANRPRHA